MGQGMSRLQIQTLLENLNGGDEDHPELKIKVYFQPPPNVQMQYPCIVYRRDSAVSLFANNKPYRFVQRYSVTVIDRDPDSAIPDKIAALSTSTFNRSYVADNLNHDVFNVFF